MSYREVRIARAELDTLSDRQIEQKLESGGLYLRATIQYHEEPGTRDMVYSQGGPCLCGKCRPIDPVKQRLEALERVAQAVRDWQAVDDLVLELEMYALERTKHELLIIEALKALDNYTSSGIESGETK